MATDQPINKYHTHTPNPTFSSKVKQIRLVALQTRESLSLAYFSWVDLPSPTPHNCDQRHRHRERTQKRYKPIFLCIPEPAQDTPLFLSPKKVEYISLPKRATIHPRHCPKRRLDDLAGLLYPGNVIIPPTAWTTPFTA